MPDGGEILNKNICKKTSGLLFAAIFLLSGGVLAGCGGGESESEEIISCYLDFINPETGEYLAESPLTYKDCYLTYDGTEKTLNYVVRVIDNDEIITPKIEVTLHYSKEPSEGSPGYKANAVKERGVYYLVVDDIRYNIEKYFIFSGATVPIYVQ